MFLLVARVFIWGYLDVSRVCQSVDMQLLGFFLGCSGWLPECCSD